MIIDFRKRFLIATCTKTGTNSLESALVTRAHGCCFTVRLRHRMDLTGLVLRPDVYRITTCRHPLSRWCSGYAHHLRAPFWSALKGVPEVTADVYASVFFDKRDTENEKSSLWTWTQAENHKVLRPSMRPFMLEEGLEELIRFLRCSYEITCPDVTHVYRRKQTTLTDEQIVGGIVDEDNRARLLAWCQQDCEAYGYEMPRYLR